MLLALFFKTFNAQSTFARSTRTQGLKKKQLNPVIFVVIVKLSLSTHVPGFGSFLVFLHHFVLAKLTISSIRVKGLAYTPIIA